MKGSIILLFCLFTFFITCNALDINTTQPLTDGETIVSERGEFEMGFFNTKGLPQNRYFGIWYKKISTGTVVWVANREIPVANTSGVVRVTSKGIVVLANETIVWSSNSSTSVNNPIAQLQDTGNLVFRDENSDGPESIIWQSFDHPVDNFLPRMKYGINFVTGMERYISSWKSVDDPSPGDFVYRFDPKGYPQVELRKGSNLTYRTGPWVGDRYSGIPKIPNDIFTVQYVLSEKEVYYKFEVTNTSESPIVRSILTPQGDLQRLVWDKQSQQWREYLSLQVDDCDGYRLCGGNGVCNINNAPKCECMQWFHPNFQEAWSSADWSGGCARNTQLDCENGDGFVKVSGLKLPDTRLSWYNLNQNRQECERRCLNNCSCMAYSNTDDRGGSGCLLWFGDLNDMRYTNDGQDLYIRIAASELGFHKNSRLKLAIASAVGGCSIFLLVILIIYRRRLRAKYGSSMFSKDSSSYPKDVESFIKQYGSSIPKRFRYPTLKKITNSFKDELGKGGYGNVYKGHLADGRVVAVKVLKSTKGNGEEFINEVASIGKTSHVNIVTLLGFCYEGKKRALIYEFMPNGSLEKFIYGTTTSLEGPHLGWEKLYSIAVGIARGLEYLHRGCNTRILHFDIKPHNILLDEKFRPKISDFGLAKLYTTDESAVSLLQARGTIGYIAPEVTSRHFGQVSHKSDVYSYGMMILEMVGGRKNVNAGADHTSEIYYPRWLYKRIQSDDVLNLANEISAEENELVRKMVIVGLWCIKIYPSQRPSISKVIEMLEGQRAALEIPPQPYLCSVPSSPSNSQKKLVFSSSSGTEPTSSA